MFDWKKILLKPSSTLTEAIQVLDKEALRIVLVVDEEGRLLGTVTDGDVRRALIRHFDMETLLSDVMFRDPTTASVEDDRKAIMEKMKAEDLLQVPILDSLGRVVGLETLQRLLTRGRRDNPVFLMAGGFGKRLRPLTDDIPKPLLRVGNKPILESILMQFVESGFYEFYVSTHYKAEMVREYFGDGSKWGVSINYIHEEKPLGTAGALGLLPKGIPDMPLIMMNGDLLTKINFDPLIDFHIEQGGCATMCVREYDFQVPYGVIETDGLQVSSIVEKPIHRFFVNAGIYVLEPELVRGVAGNIYLDMPNLLEEQIQKNRQVNMFPIHEYWLDIGRMEEFERAQGDVKGIFL